MKKERTFFEIIKKFTKPYFETPKVTLKTFVFYAIWATGPLMHVFFIQKVTEAIEVKDKDAFIFIIIVYIFCLTTYYILTFLTRTW
jgi:hypothetical protein